MRWLLILFLSAAAAFAQAPPANPALARSAWPIYHHDTYAQAYTPLRGPEPGDQTEVQYIEAPGRETSPWTVLTAPYPNGAQAAWGSSRTHVFKAVIEGGRFAMAGTLALPRNRWHFDWGIAALADGTVLTMVRARRSFVIIGDRRPGDPNSDIGVVRWLPLPDGMDPTPHFSVAHDGTVLFLTTDARLAALDLRSGRVLAAVALGGGQGDIAVHNSFPVDETGAVFLVSNQALTRVEWDGRALRVAWRAPYDSRGPGCEGTRAGVLREAVRVARGEPCTGSGTTPTLLGGARDGVAVIVDGHRPANNLVAFWRDAPPAGWRALPGQDARVAGVLRLPHATPEGRGFSTENSPAAGGFAVAAAQWNGFDPPCDPVPGVQQVRWDPTVRRLALTWANPAVHMNGVLTHAAGSGLLYSTGRRGCIYRLVGLDWRTGEVRLDVPLGDDPRFIDPGNQIVVLPDRSLLYGSARGLVRIMPAP